MTTHKPLQEQRKGYEATAWARATRGHTNPTQKLILMFLADLWNPAYGYAWPTIRMLAADGEISTRSVLRHLNNLERQGFIVINHHDHGDHSRNNSYSFNFDKLTGDKLTRVTGDPTGDTGDPTGDTGDPTGDTGAYITPSNSQITNNQLLDETDNQPTAHEIMVEQPGDIQSDWLVDRVLALKDVPHSDMIDGAYLVHLDKLYGGTMTPAAIDAAVAAALNHTAYKKWTNKRLGVTQWVGRQAKWAKENQGKARRVEPTNDANRYAGGF